MKAGGLLSMIACFFIMRDVVIKFNKGERIRLTHKIVCEVCIKLYALPSSFCNRHIINNIYVYAQKYNDHYNIVLQMSLALFWASFFSPFMSTWMGK